jgi:hypothetical protein
VSEKYKGQFVSHGSVFSLAKEVATQEMECIYLKARGIYL